MAKDDKKDNMEEKELQEKSALNPVSGLGAYHDKITEIYDSCLGLHFKADRLAKARDCE